MIRIGFDIGGVLSKYPDILRPIVAALLGSPSVEVHILSDMHPHAKCVAFVHDNGFPVPPERIHSCDYSEHGEECKAIRSREIGLDILVDDFPGYVASLGAPALRLLAMPDPTRDYYHPSWKTDGSEGNFGRRKKAAAVAESAHADSTLAPERRVWTALPLTAADFDPRYLRRPGVTGTCVSYDSHDEAWTVRHNDGTHGPYAADELTPIPVGAPETLTRDEARERLAIIVPPPSSESISAAVSYPRHALATWHGAGVPAEYKAHAEHARNILRALVAHLNAQNADPSGASQ